MLAATNDSTAQVGEEASRTRTFRDIKAAAEIWSTTRCSTSSHFMERFYKSGSTRGEDTVDHTMGQLINSVFARVQISASWAKTRTSLKALVFIKEAPSSGVQAIHHLTRSIEYSPRQIRRLPCQGTSKGQLEFQTRANLPLSIWIWRALRVRLKRIKFQIQCQRIV